MNTENRSCKIKRILLENLYQHLCCLICVILILLSMIVLFWTTKPIFQQTAINTIYIDAEKHAIHKVDAKYLSIGLDDIVLAENFKGFNMSDPKLIKLIKYLTPAYLRVGGNLADKLLFDPDESVDNSTFSNNITDDVKLYKNCWTNRAECFLAPNYTLTGNQWLKLAALARQSNVDVIFDLNALIRDENGAWNHRNAEKLCDFSQRHNLSLNWELGNEPNAFPHKFNETVNATQLGQDFNTLKNILNKYEMYKDSLLVGPDVDRLSADYSGEFLEKVLRVGGRSLNAITWHQYYLNGRTAKHEDFLNPDIFDTIQEQISSVKNITQSLGLEDTPIWLGETASAYGGGAPNMSDRFIATFIWLDKLGLSARMGLDVIIRQSIFRGNYALLDENYDPNPDWWLSILYKLLVGREVVPSTTSCNRKVRLYSHCANPIVFSRYTQPALTVFGMNLDRSPSLVKIEGVPASRPDQNSIVYAFELTPGSKVQLVSKKIQLNGRLLNLLRNNNLPKFVPKVIRRHKPFFIMPPYSLVFWVIPDAYVKSCMSES